MFNFKQRIYMLKKLLIALIFLGTLLNATDKKKLYKSIDRF